MTVMKVVRIAESKSLELRAEAFNLIQPCAVLRRRCGGWRSE